jgi:hypothetical protein
MAFESASGKAKEFIQPAILVGTRSRVKGGNPYALRANELLLFASEVGNAGFCCSKLNTLINK